MKLRLSNIQLVLVLAAVALAVALLLLLPQVRRLQAAEARLAEETARSQQVQTTSHSLAQLAAKEAELEKKLATLDALLPATPGEEAVIKEIQTMADEAGVEFISIRPGARVTRDNYVEMPLELSFAARYHQVVDFLQRLQTAPRAYRVDQLKLGRGQPDYPELQVDVTAAAFYVAQEGE